MKIQRIVEGLQTCFVVSDVDPIYFNAFRDLEFTNKENNFILTYSTATSHLDGIYQNFERFVEEMILQTARFHPVPWEEALQAFLSIVYGQGIDWYLVGSTALAVRGIEILPRDIDLVVDTLGAHRLGELLLDSLIQPVQETPGWIADWFGRAFLHTRLEWVGGVNEQADQPEVSDFGLVAAQRLEAVNWHGYQLQVPPLEMQLRVSERRGLLERVEKIKAALI